MQQRRNLMKGLLGLGGLSGLSALAKGASPDLVASQQTLFFKYRDTVINFNGSTGVGDHCGTVEGEIQGTSVTNFQFIPTSQTTIQYNNRMLITDLDGNQMIFQVQGTGIFIVPPPTDSSSTLGNLMALGGPLVATATVTVATGIYEFLLGSKFPVKMAACNVTNPSTGVLGNVYGEVYVNSVGITAALAERRAALGQR